MAKLHEEPLICRLHFTMGCDPCTIALDQLWDMINQNVEEKVVEPKSFYGA